MSVVLLKSRSSLTFGVFRTEQIFWIFDKLRGKFRGSYWRYIRIKPNANGLHYVLFYLFCSFVCVKIEWIVCCRWIRAPADACFVQSVKHDKLDFRALVWKRTSNSYNISSFWICSIRLINVWEHITSLDKNMWTRQKQSTNLRLRFL